MPDFSAALDYLESLGTPRPLDQMTHLHLFETIVRDRNEACEALQSAVDSFNQHGTGSAAASKRRLNALSAALQALSEEDVLHVANSLLAIDDPSSPFPDRRWRKGLAKIIENAIATLPKTRGTMPNRQLPILNGRREVVFVRYLATIFAAFGGPPEFSKDQSNDSLRPSLNQPDTRFETFLGYVLSAMRKDGVQVPDLKAFRRHYIKPGLEDWRMVRRKNLNTMPLVENPAIDLPVPRKRGRPKG